MIGIVSYGVYIPKSRIKVEEIARVWGHDAKRYAEELLVNEKSVPSIDEDTITISVESARNALRMAKFIDPSEIGALYVGSESHPYAVKPTATVVAEAIGSTPFLTAADMEFACKAGTAGIQACMGLVEAKYIKYGMAIGADNAQARPSDALEYTASCGAAAYIIGCDKVLVEIEGTYSLTSDLPDFWRREGSNYPRHAGRFTGQPGYFSHVINCSKNLMKKLGTNPKDYNYVVFHQPNGKFPLKAANILGFDEKKVKPGLIVTNIGNTYSASSLLGLAAILDQAKPGEKILMTSYGAGAGSDSFSLIVTDEIETRKGVSPSLLYYIERKEYLDYATYSKFKGQLKGFNE